MNEHACAEPVADHGLEIRCPRCGHVETDGYEVLDDNQMYSQACPACAQPFYLLVAECPRCEEETAITWPDLPTPQEVERLRCLRCDARIIPDEEAPHAMGFDSDD